MVIGPQRRRLASDREPQKFCINRDKTYIKADRGHKFPYLSPRSQTEQRKKFRPWLKNEMFSHKKSKKIYTYTWPDSCTYLWTILIMERVILLKNLYNVASDSTRISLSYLATVRFFWFWYIGR